MRRRWRLSTARMSRRRSFIIFSGGPAEAPEPWAASGRRGPISLTLGRALGMKLAIAAVFVLLPLEGALAANGCPPGTFSITHSPDGRAASVLFDHFSVAGGNGIPGETGICSLQVSMTVPAGSVGVYKVDYRGFAHLAAHQ